MGEKLRFHHITHVLVSFCVFILAGRLAELVIGTLTSLNVGLSELLAFLFASACTVLAFRAFEKIVPPPEDASEHRSVMQGRFKQRPFSLRRYAIEAVPHVVLTSALLVVAMYLVTIAFHSGGSLIHAELYTRDIPVLLSLLVIHPVVEEYLFRGMFYGKLRTMSPMFACLMQAVMFAISHNGVGSMMYALIAGIIIGAAAERSNGIAVPIAAHLLINLRTFLCSGILDGSLYLTIDLALIGAGVISAGVLLVVARWFPAYAKPQKTPTEREEADFDDEPTSAD